MNSTAVEDRILSIAEGVREALVETLGREWSKDNPEDLKGCCFESSVLLNTVLRHVLPDVSLELVHGGLYLWLDSVNAQWLHAHWWLAVSGVRSEEMFLDLTATQFREALKKTGGIAPEPIIWLPKQIAAKEMFYIDETRNSLQLSDLDRFPLNTEPTLPKVLCLVPKLVAELAI